MGDTFKGTKSKDDSEELVDWKEHQSKSKDDSDESVDWKEQDAADMLCHTSDEDIDELVDWKDDRHKCKSKSEGDTGKGDMGKGASVRDRILNAPGSFVKAEVKSSGSRRGPYSLPWSTAPRTTAPWRRSP